MRFHNNYDSTLAISYCDIANFGGDLNLDCTIDLLDFGIMMSSWLDYVGPE